jgi:hypothetical protein
VPAGAVNFVGIVPRSSGSQHNRKGTPVSIVLPQRQIRRIADTIKSAARVAVRLGDSEWCELVFVTFPEKFGEVEETLQIGAMTARVKVHGEIVRLHLHFNDCPSLSTIIRDALRMALEPFFIGDRQFTVHDTAEGFVIVLLDDREIEIIHNGTPKSAKAPLE